MQLAIGSDQETPMRCEMRKKTSTNGRKINKSAETPEQGIL
jgi:hypothetical protein